MCASCGSPEALFCAVWGQQAFFFGAAEVLKETLKLRSPAVVFSGGTPFAVCYGGRSQKVLKKEIRVPLCAQPIGRSVVGKTLAGLLGANAADFGAANVSGAAAVASIHARGIR